VIYSQGQGVPRDYGLAAKWYRLAAERGQRDAQLNLAALYVSGRGVDRDYVSAMLWLKVAAAAGEEDAVHAKGQIAARMTPAQIEQAGALAAAWKACQSKQECDARVKR
jgi:TPR repeat protein